MPSEQSKYYSIIFLYNLVRHFVFFFFPLYFLDIGLNGFQTGLLMGLLTITGILFTYHIGIKTDSVHQKKLVITGIIFAILFSVGLIFVRNFYLLILVFLIGGLAKTIVKRSTDTLVYKSTKSGMDLAKFQIINGMPIAVGILIGALIINYFGYLTIFTFSIIALLPVIYMAAKIQTKSLYKFEIRHYLQDLKNTKVLFFCLIIFIFSLHFGAEQVAYSPYLKVNLSLSLIPTSLFIASVVLFLILGSYVGGVAIDKKLNLSILISIAMFLSGIGSIIFAINNNLIISFLGRAIHDLGDGIFFVMMSAGIVSLFNVKRVGGNAGFVNLVLMLATFVGSILFGFVGFAYGYAWPHILTGALSVLSFFLISGFYIFRKKNRFK